MRAVRHVSLIGIVVTGGWALATARGADPATDAPARLPVPEGVEVDGIPAVPASLAAAIASFAATRPVHFTAWHPTRREMVVSSSVDGVAQVHSLAAPMGPLSQLTRNKQVATSYVTFPRHRSDFIILVRGTAENANASQLWRVDLAPDAKPVRLTDGTSRHWWGPWSNASDHLAYTATSLDGAETSVCVVDPLDPKTARVLCTVEGALWYPTDWSKDDRTLLLLEVVSMTESYLWTVDVETGEKKPLVARGGDKMGFGWANYSRDNRSILLASDKGAEYQRPCRLELESKKLEPLGDTIKWHVERFALSPDRRTLAVVTNEDGSGRIHVLDAETGAERAFPRLPAGHVNFVAFHENSKDLAFEVESARSPAETWSLDLATGAVEKWAESGVSEALAAGVVEPELVRWKGPGGLALSGWLSKPPAKFKGKRPVVVQLHDGPEGQARPTFRGKQNYIPAELGVAVLEPNVRGSSGYGKSFLALDDGAKRADAIQDVAALLDWIKTRDDLDADRVLLAGTRYGGFLALAAAAQLDARIKGTIDLGGWVDLISFIDATPEVRRAAVKAEYGDDEDSKTKDFLDQISPVTNASKIKRPLFMANGAKDPRVPVAELEQMALAVRKNDVKVWTLLDKDSPNPFIRPKTAELVFDSSVLFIREVLLGEQAEKE